VVHKANRKTKASPSLHPNSPARVSLITSGRPTDVEVQISIRAYQIYADRGGETGHDLEDWLRAETEVLRQKIGTLGM
jgi:hypothetical protein